MDLTTSTETERKYEAAGPPPDLTGTGPVSEVREQPVLGLDAVYYDTRDGCLAADGITLRHRTGGKDAGWHLKLPLARGVREEIRVPKALSAPVGSAPPRPGARPEGEVPEELAALVRSRARHAALVPVVRLRTEREPRLLLDAGGTALAELVVDRVTAERRGRTARWTEIEVELAEDGDPAVLEDVDRRLREAGLRPAPTASKLARALAETDPLHGAAPADLGGGAAGSHVLAYARKQVRALIELDPAVRRGQHDSVHRMRVATRRLRSCFRSYSRVLERAVTDSVGDELRWLAAELGVDRDREVLTERLDTRLAELPEKLRRGPVAERLHEDDRSRTTDARSRLAGVLDSERYLDLLDTLDALLATPPLRRPAEKPAAPVLKRVVRRDLDRLAGRIDTALSTPPGPGRDAALHAARKAAKRARYAAEAARPALGGKARRRVSRLASVQRVLGEHQDSVLARTALVRIADEAQTAGEPAFSYGLLYGREEALAETAERQLPGVADSCPGLRVRPGPRGQTPA